MERRLKGVLPFQALNVIKRVHKHTVFHDAEVAVVAGGVACGAHLGDLLTLVDMLAYGDDVGRVVAVVGLVTVAVVDDDKVTVAAHPWCRRRNPWLSQAFDLKIQRRL